MTQAGEHVARVVVELHVGDSRMAATDDPLFLRIAGRGGREFRLELARGKALRRKSRDVFVFGGTSDSDTNVAYPDLNDPTRPGLPLEHVDGAFLRKGLSPVPNVRGIGELDDRLELSAASVTLRGTGGGERRFSIQGPVWLGLVCGMSVELVADASDG